LSLLLTNLLRHHPQSAIRHCTTLQIHLYGTLSAERPPIPILAACSAADLPSEQRHRRAPTEPKFNTKFATLPPRKTPAPAAAHVQYPLGGYPASRRPFTRNRPSLDLIALSASQSKTTKLAGLVLYFAAIRPLLGPRTWAHCGGDKKPP
jgi:hypothetical protein